MADYSKLKAVLDAAYNQSAHGKGKARHANGKDFHRQPILEIGRMVGPGYAVGQLMKKAQEATGMVSRCDHSAAIQELLGTIVYAAAAVVLITELQQQFERDIALAAKTAEESRLNTKSGERAYDAQAGSTFLGAADRLRAAAELGRPDGVFEVRGHDGLTQGERLAGLEGELHAAISSVRRGVGPAASFTDGRDGPLS